MKSKKIVAILFLSALLLSSCASGEGASAPDSPATAESQEASGLTVLPMDDPMAGIDDSLSFSVEPDINSTYYESYTGLLRENFKAAYAEKLSAYFDRMEINNISCLGYMPGGGMTGWFTFTATPRPGSGIEPREQYCRSFNIRSENEGWTLIEFQRSWPMEPVWYASQWLSSAGLSDTMPDAFKEKKLSGLVEAELYVRQLDNRYILTGPAELGSLARSLSGSDIYMGDPTDASDYNPLYLRFEDGSSYLVPTAADGSNRCFIWDSWYAYMDGESIFQHFGVPLEAEGYENLSGGGVRTTVHSTYPQQDNRTHMVEYSAQGTPVRYLFQQMVVGISDTRYVDILRLYEYDAQGHRIKEEYLVDGELLTTTVYEYSGSCWCVRRRVIPPAAYIVRLTLTMNLAGTLRAVTFSQHPRPHLLQRGLLV